MERKIASCCVVGIALLAASICQAAIDRGSIQGTVTDAQAAAIPRVRVEIMNTATGVTTTTTTNDTGFYAAAELVPGTYKVRFQGQGFATLELTSIEVKAGTTVTVDGSLEDRPTGGDGQRAGRSSAGRTDGLELQHGSAVADSRSGPDSRARYPDLGAIAPRRDAIDWTIGLGVRI